MSHPPQDGKVYDTACTQANAIDATCDGDGLNATAENSDGYFTLGNRYVWHVKPAAPKPDAGDAGEASSGD